MSRESLVRRLPELAFAVLFGGGLVLGGGAALAGMLDVFGIALPGMSAKADVQPAHEVVRLALPAKFLKSDENGHAPQVLYPVRASPLPDWLTQAIGEV